MLPNSPYLTKLLADAHIEDLRRAAASSRLARTPDPVAPRAWGRVFAAVW